MINRESKWFIAVRPTDYRKNKCYVGYYATFGSWKDICIYTSEYYNFDFYIKLFLLHSN